MTDDDYEPFRAELRDSLPVLLELRERYLKLLARLPVSPYEDDMLEGRRPHDFPTELRGVLECVLADALSESLIESVRQAAEYRPEAVRRPVASGPTSLRQELTALLRESIQARK